MELELHKIFESDAAFLLKVVKVDERVFIARKIIVRSIKDKDEETEEDDYDTIANEEHFMYFIELLNGFASNILDLEKVYYLNYYSGGYEAGIVQKKVQKRGKEEIVYSLCIIPKISKKKIFLSKYDCKVIVSTFRSIYSKCTRSEFA